MPTTPALNGQVISLAERSTRAVLDRLLARSGTPFHHWVVLNFTADNGGAVDRSLVIARMTSALRLDESVVLDVFAQLAGLDLITVDSTLIRLTDAGQARFQQIRPALDEITGRLYGGLTTEDLATAARVLTSVTAQANAELTSA